MGKELIHCLKKLIPNPHAASGCVVLKHIGGQHKLELGKTLADQQIQQHHACSCPWTVVLLAEQRNVVHRYCTGKVSGPQGNSFVKHADHSDLWHCALAACLLLW